MGERKKKKKKLERPHTFLWLLCGHPSEESARFLVSECALTSHFSFPFCNAGPRSSFLFKTAGTCCCDQCPLSCVKGLPRTLNVCCINTDLPRHVADGASVRVRRLKIFSAQFKPGPVHPVRRLSPCTLFGGAANVHTTLCPVLQFTLVLPAPSFVVLLRHISVKFFFSSFFTTRVMKYAVYAQRVCFCVFLFLHW